MADPVYEIEALMKRAVELLRGRSGFTSTGQVALALGVPWWAADSALEAAYLARQARFEAGAGWKAVEVETPRELDDNRLQPPLQ